MLPSMSPSMSPPFGTYPSMYTSGTRACCSIPISSPCSCCSWCCAAPAPPRVHPPPPGHPGRSGSGVALPRRMVDHWLGPLYILVHGPGDGLLRGLGGLLCRVSAGVPTGLTTQNAWADGLSRPSAHAFILPEPERPGAISWCSRAGGCRRWCPRPSAPRSPPGTSPPPGRRSGRPPPSRGR